MGTNPTEPCTGQRAIVRKTPQVFISFPLVLGLQVSHSAGWPDSEDLKATKPDLGPQADFTLIGSSWQV